MGSSFLIRQTSVSIKAVLVSSIVFTIPLFVIWFALIKDVGVETTRRKTHMQLCVQRTGGLTPEGVGSIHQRIKASIILASVIGADLRLPGLVANRHGYVVPWLKTGSCPPSSSTSCLINNTSLETLIQRMCGGTLRGRAVLAALEIPQFCSTIYHHVEQVHAHEGLNDCVGKWYQEALLSNGRIFTQESGRVTVGVHLRWGDVARPGVTALSAISTHNLRGSPSITQVNDAYANIVFIDCHRVVVHLYMEKHPNIQPGTFTFPNFTVVDSGDDIADLRHYASNDVLIGGTSSWAVFAAFASTDGTIVITDALHAKYRQTYRRHIKHLHQYGDRVNFRCSRYV